MADASVLGTDVHDVQVQVLSPAPYMIDEMAIYLKALEFQGFFRILGVKNIFHFYGCEIPTSETRTCDF